MDYTMIFVMSLFGGVIVLILIYVLITCKQYVHNNTHQDTYESLDNSEPINNNEINTEIIARMYDKPDMYI